MRIETRDPTLTYPRAVREEKLRLILPTRGTSVLFAKRGGSSILNSFRAVDKWISALVIPLPGLALAG